MELTKNKRSINRILIYTGIFLLAFFASATFSVSPAEAVVQDVDSGGYSSTPNHTDVNKTVVQEKFDEFFKDWKAFMGFLAGIATLSCILAFIVLMVKLGSAGDNPFLRQKIMKDILVVFVSACILGSASVFLFLLAQIGLS